MPHTAAKVSRALSRHKLQQLLPRLTDPRPTRASQQPILKRILQPIHHKAGRLDTIRNDSVSTLENDQELPA